MSSTTVENPSELLTGMKIKGEKKSGTWTINRRLTRDRHSTGGTFSIGYMATHEDGTEAFVKATDIGLLNQNRSTGNRLQQMADALTQQKFEREMLDICRGNNMDRVVNALDYGEFETTHGGVRDYVFFIMFEPAKGDARQQVNREKRGSIAWAATALHNLSVAVQQLHTSLIAHNDIKPSNLLVFDQHLQKLADLGRATSENLAGPWDKLNFAGDLAYRAPEYWYPSYQVPAKHGRIDFEVRRTSDFYLLGALGFFLVAGDSLNSLLRANLRPEHSPGNWGGSFDDVVPYLHQALVGAFTYFDSELPTDEQGNHTKDADALRQLILELCNPDPRYRGRGALPGSAEKRRNIEFYVSSFDRIAKKLELHEKLRR